MKRLSFSLLIAVVLALVACSAPTPYEPALAPVTPPATTPAPAETVPAPEPPVTHTEPDSSHPEQVVVPKVEPIVQDNLPTPSAKMPAGDSTPPQDEKPPAAKQQPPAVEIPRGTTDPNIAVAINKPEKTWAHTTIMADNHDLSRPRIIEVNMLGEVVWEYKVPQQLVQYTNPGFDVEPLPSNNVLFVLPRYGVFEVDRDGKTVWSYLDSKVSHDADRLPNGNTLVVYGANDQPDDTQVKEVNPQGQVVWSWHALDYFNSSPYKDVNLEGWTHTNAASKLPGGNTLISLRNFHFVAEVDSTGAVVRKIGEGILKHQHDPELLSNGNILMADHSEPQRAIELDPIKNSIVWEFLMPRQLVRDANRLPNGNTLITGSTAIVEVTGDGEVVWHLTLKGVPIEKAEGPARGFYKAERISAR